MIRFLTNKWVHFLILLGLLLGAVYFSGSSHDLRKRLQYATFDTFNKLKPRDPSHRVAIIDIDEESLKKMGQWPWPRPVVGNMIKRLNALGAQVIAFDMVFAEPDRTSPSRVLQYLPEGAGYDSIKTSLQSLPDNDLLFADDIASAGNVVTGFTSARAEQTYRIPYQVAAPTFLGVKRELFVDNCFAPQGVAANLPSISKAAAGNGSFMATPNTDGVIRQVPAFVVYPRTAENGEKPEIYQSLSLESLRVGLSKNARFIVKPRDNKGYTETNYHIVGGSYDIPIERDGRLWIYFRPIPQSDYISAYKIFDEAYAAELKEQVKGKILFVGSSAEGLKDLRSSPLSPAIPGVEMHVNIAEQVLQGKYLTRPAFLVIVEGTIILCAGLLIILFAPFMNVIVLGILTAGLMFCMFLGSWEAYVSAGLLVDPVYPAIALSVLFLVSSLLSYIRSESERRQVRQAFGYYISPSFMEELTKNPDKLKLGGEVRDLSVMFTDIRSFTTISERLTPEELIHLMNDFLTPMSDLVMENRGTIDKYMGDAMMAFWNAPLDDPDHARHACVSALKMGEALVPVNEQIKARAASEGRDPVLLNAGIGINTGPCSVGNMGSKQRFAYSALGDAVNLASRLESQTKSYGVNILVGEETQKLVPDMALLELDLIRVKGKEKPVHIYTLLGDEGMGSTETFKSWKKAHNGFLAAYRIADFNCAAQDMVTARSLSSGLLDGYYAVFSARIAEFMKNPPPEGWDGVFVAKEK